MNHTTQTNNHDRHTTMSLTDPFEPTHLLKVHMTTQLQVGSSVRTHRTALLLPIQLTGWHGFDNANHVEYVLPQSQSSHRLETFWTNKSDLLPLPNIVTTLEQEDTPPWQT